jgi:endonuclease III
MLDEADTVSEQAWADLAAKYQNLADSAGASANDIEGMIAQIGASAVNLDNLFGNVSSGKGSKGSGDSKGKTYDKEDLKTLQEVEDRYHEINREIQRQDDLLDDLSNTTDRAWGTDALDGYENEIKALEKQQELYNQKLKEAQDYLVQDSALVKKYFADAQIGADGEITNYEDLLRENLNLYNAAVERYNLAVAGKTLSEEEHTALKNQLDAEKKLFEQRQKALEQYESTLDVVRDTTDNIQENARSIADKKLEEIKFKMEIVLDVKSMKDAVRDLSKEIAEMFGDALTHGFESAKLSAEGAQAEAALLPSYQEEWNSLKELYESTTDDADRRAIMDEIKSLQGNIVDSAKAIAEWANSIEDIVPDAVDAASERFAAFTDQLEHNTSVLDTIKELYTLQGVTYKTAEGFNRLQKNSQEKLNA